MGNNFKQWNLDQTRVESKIKKNEIRARYSIEKHAITLEYQEKMRRLDEEMEKELDKVSMELAKFEDDYRQWRHEQFAAQSKEGGEQ